MRVAVFALASVTGVAITPGLAEESKELSQEAKRKLKVLEGKWQAVKLVHADREVAQGTGFDEFVVEFRGSTIDLGGVLTASVVALDPETAPTCLDFKVASGSGVLKKGATYESVYQLDGDTLTWAFYHGREKNRPTSVDKPTDPAVMVMVFNRVKR